MIIQYQILKLLQKYNGIVFGLIMALYIKTG